VIAANITIEADKIAATASTKAAARA